MFLFIAPSEVCGYFCKKSKFFAPSRMLNDKDVSPYTPAYRSTVILEGAVIKLYSSVVFWYCTVFWIRVLLMYRCWIVQYKKTTFWHCALYCTLVYSTVVQLHCFMNCSLPAKYPGEQKWFWNCNTNWNIKIIVNLAYTDIYLHIDLLLLYAKIKRS